MARHGNQEERMKLVKQITEWNANRLDLFEISVPDENNEFYGVMRYFYQDDDGKVSTKCIRVAGSATTQDVLETLVEKFRPDMRMLSLPQYSLYEVHLTEERKLEMHERPLFVQLNWGKDDIEGRFLLKRVDVKATPLPGMEIQNQDPPPMKRKLSKREKKEQKKKEKEAKLKGKENEHPEGVAERLYSDLPDTSFTRTISNPEVVMRRRRQQKLEKKLQEIRSRDDQGGTLKIYGESIRPDVPYKTLLLSAQDPAWYVVKETLDKYGLEKEDPDKFCLLQVLMPPEGSTDQPRSVVLDDEDCPLNILMQHPTTQGTIMFQLRRRTADMAPAKRKKKRHGEDMTDPRGQSPSGPRLPLLVEINPDGSEPPKAIRHQLVPNVTEVGSDKSVPPSPHFLRLLGPDIQPRHCVINSYDGVVTITPGGPHCVVYVNNIAIREVTVLQHGATVRFGKMHGFRFLLPQDAPNPNAGERPRGPQQQQQRGGPNDNLETTFDVDGHIDTHQDQDPRMNNSMQQQQAPQFRGMAPTLSNMPDDLLPAALEFRDETEEPMLSAVIPEVNGKNVQFKLAPTYTLYMAVRYRISMHYRPDMPPAERAHRVTNLCNKMAHLIERTVQENRNDAGGLSYWMANASELLHFFKADVDIGPLTTGAQELLAEAVQVAFSHLVGCLQEELHQVMPAMLSPNRDDMEDNEVLSVLASAMSLLRKCRVNAALTIQLFSQLFHYINMWLFNHLVTTPPHQGLCSRAWGQRFKQRLGRVENWAEKQGLELAADCHLARIVQAAHLLECSKTLSDEAMSISSTCYKLNSLQLRTLLGHYQPGPGEPHVPPELINQLVGVAMSTADEQTRTEGKAVQLKEDADLQLPFLLPEDGYSSEIIKSVPIGLAEFVDPLTHAGLCRLIILPKSSGMWTVYMDGDVDQNENLRAASAANGAAAAQADPHRPSPPPGQQPPPVREEVIYVSFPKVKGSMGLSIVAAKGEGQKEKGIYIKSVVPSGAADLDGRLQAGDQLLEVDGANLVGLSQEKAAEHMKRTGHTVTLKVLKQGAIYHGLATLLSQPSPRGSPTGMHPSQGHPAYPQQSHPQGHPQGHQGPPPHPQVPHPSQKPMRPMSEDVSRFGPPPHDQFGVQKPLGMQHGGMAKSSPALAQQPQHPSKADDPYASMPRGGYPQQQHQRQGPPQQQSHPDMRSKSTSNLDRPEHAAMDRLPPQHSGTLPRPAPGQQHFMSQPDLHTRGPPAQGGDPDYENYPGAPPKPARYQQGPDYVNQQDLKSYGGPSGGGGGGGMPQSQSMGNVRDGDGIGGGQPQRMMQRPQSDESLDHRTVREWQQRNELQQQQPDVPRSSNQQQYPPMHSFYQNTQPRDDVPPPFNRMQGAPVTTPQQQLQQQHNNNKPQNAGAQKPPVMLQEVPRMDSDAANRQRQNHFFEPQQQQRQAPYGQQQQQQGPPPPTSQGYQPPTSQGYQPPPTSQGYQQGPPPTSQGYQQGPPPTSQGYHPPTSAAQQSNLANTAPVTQQFPGYPGPGGRFVRPGSNGNKPPTPTGYPGDNINKRPTSQYHPNQHPQESPELPPPPPQEAAPPELPPPPQEEQLPPPPPPPQEYEQQMREEQQQKMNQSAASYSNYQNLPPTSAAPSNNNNYPSAAIGKNGGNGNYPYAPRPAKPATAKPAMAAAASSSLARHNDTLARNPNPADRSFTNNQYNQPQPQQQPAQRPVPAKKPPPPINPKPKLLAQEISELKKKANSPSPWEREQKELEIKRKEEEISMHRASEIAALEEREMYLTPEEREKLKRLRLDTEFDRRMQEAVDKDDDDDDITETAAGRARMLRLMQEEAEKKRRLSEKDQHNMEVLQEMSDYERIQRNERKLQQYERERQEQKQKQMQRQEKRAQETEAMMSKQREQRERQTREFEEQASRQREEENRARERKQEEERRKKEMEREHMESMREGEADNTKQRFMDRVAEREAAMKREREQQRRGEPATSYRTSGPPGNSYPPLPNNGPPPPAPERKSSYDVYKAQGNLSSAAGGLFDGMNTSRTNSVYGQPQGQAPTSQQQPQQQQPPHRYSYMQQQQQQQQQEDLNNTPSKKSVSFQSEPPTEFHYRKFSSQTSDGGSSSTYPAGSPQSPFPPPLPQSQPPQQQQRGGYQGYQGPPQQQQVRTPDNPAGGVGAAHYTTGDGTPGVVGAQEVYRDPRERMLAAKQNGGSGPVGGITPNTMDRLSFRDKMKLFASEIGDSTPEGRSKASSAQQRIEATLTSP